MLLVLWLGIVHCIDYDVLVVLGLVVDNDHPSWNLQLLSHTRSFALDRVGDCFCSYKMEMVAQ
jgi:hypothetical protein